MASTNMLQWNPTAANQENDAAYAADSQRAGGATNPSLFDATLANKLFYQCTTYLEALFTAFANKGFSTSDANLATLTTQCANFLTSADVKPAVLLVSFATTLVWNGALANGFVTTLTGNVTSFSLTGFSTYQRLLLIFVQDGVGGRTVPLASPLVNPGTINSAPNSTSMQEFVLLADGLFHPLGAMTWS